MATTLPAELKPISPYLARATELAKAEPVISYWCESLTLLSPASSTLITQTDTLSRSSQAPTTPYSMQ
jgi:hypothetical protein